ncbi:MAG TPA: hypothetical protein VET88_04385 [Gammaproteobacteria bacterium]|nr:hypothetical protein [Gammaproteobacteria bacterium]
MYLKVLVILLFAGIYACTRYVIFGKVYWIQIPVYILNKTLAVAAVFALMLSALGNLVMSFGALGTYSVAMLFEPRAVKRRPIPFPSLTKPRPRAREDVRNHGQAKMLE